MEFTNPTLERQRLLAALSTATPLVALVGPIGSGASTLLRQWAQHRASVTWADPRAIPIDAGDALIIDNADEMDEEGWTRLRELRITRPELLIRIAVHSSRAVAVVHEAEFVGELSFTPDETAAYLSARSSNLDPSAVQLATAGLPAAVRLVANLKTLRPEVLNQALATPHSNMLDPQHAALAIPRVLTRELVAELAGPETFIDDAEAAGLGQWIPSIDHPLFVLTAPVRAATLHARPGDASSSHSQSVRERSARVLLAQEAWYGALIEGAACGALPIVDAALKGGGMPLLRAHGPTIKALLRSIRILEMRHWPVIALALALIFNARREHRIRAAELFGIALLGAGTGQASTADRALLRVVESVARRLLGVTDGGVKAAHAAARILNELPDDEHPALVGLLGDLRTHSAISLMYGDHAEEALFQFERALAESNRPGIRLMSFGGIAMTHAFSGDLPTAQNWIDTALTHSWPQSILNEYAGSLLRIAQAKIHLEHGELDEAEAALDAIWPIIDTIEHWPALAHLRATLDICRGDVEHGRERLRALRGTRGSRMTQTQARLLDLSESSLALAAGDLSSARASTTRAGGSPAAVVGTARVEVFDGQYDRAMRLLGSIAANTPDTRASAAVLEAIILNRAGRKTEAAAAARRATTVASVHGLTTPFLLVPWEDRALFGAAVPQYAPTLHAETAVPRLTERERVILGELLVTSSMNDIARRLHVSANTVKSQRRTLYRKLGAGSREEALAIAMGHGLLAERSLTLAQLSNLPTPQDTPQ